MTSYSSLHDPENGRMHVVAFASGSGTNFREAVLESHKYNSNFSIDLLVTDKEISKGKRIGALEYADKVSIPTITVNGYRKCGSWKEAQQSVQGIGEYQKRCEEFNHEIYTKVRAFEEQAGFTFDLAVLAGYMRLFTGDLLRRFQNKAINVHPADLSVRTDNGGRKYVGENAVYDVLADGLTKTRSSIILVDAATDAGAILVLGPWAEYAGENPITQERADAHQSKQKEVSDWPALRFALREIAHGKFALHSKKFHDDGNPVVFYRDQELPYEGYLLK